MQTMFAQAKANNINAIYVTIDEYLDIFTMPSGTAQAQALQSYNQSVENFLTLAAQNGIAVDAEAGWRDWAVSTNRWKGTAIINFVSAFNKANTYDFRAVQFDVEPYLLKQYSTNPATVLTDYVTFVDGVTAQAKNLNIPLTLVIPHFYDSTQKWTPQVTYNGVTAFTFNQLLRFMAPLQNAKIIIMAYRDYAVGADGTIDISTQEIKDADATNVKVIIAQETGNVSPSYVTFYGQAKADLNREVGYVNQNYASDTSFGGIAIDYLETYMQLQ